MLKLLAFVLPLAWTPSRSQRLRDLADLFCVEGGIEALHAVAKIIAGVPPSHVGRQVAWLASQLDHALVTDTVTSALPGVIDHDGPADPGSGLRAHPVTRLHR